MRDVGDLVETILDAPEGGVRALIDLADAREQDWLALRGGLERDGFDDPRTDDDHRLHVARAVLALMNTVGGAVVIGVDERGRAFAPRGSSGDDLRERILAALTPAEGWDCTDARWSTDVERVARAVRVRVEALDGRRVGVVVVAAEEGAPVLVHRSRGERSLGDAVCVRADLGQTRALAPGAPRRRPDPAARAAALRARFDAGAASARRDEAPTWVRVDAATLASNPSSAAARARFLDGMPPDWAVAQDPEVPMPEVGEAVIAAIEAAPAGASFDLLQARRGGGKTTLLLQIAARLCARADAAVYRLHPDADSIDVDATRALVAGGRVVLVVDHADRFVDPLRAVLRGWDEQPEGAGAVHVVAASRTRRWAEVAGETYAWDSVCTRAPPPWSGWTIAPSSSGLVAELHAECAAKERVAQHARAALEELRDEDERLYLAYLAVALVDALGIDGLDDRLLADVLLAPIREVRGRVVPALARSVGVRSTTPGPRKTLQAAHPELARAAVAQAAAGADGPSPLVSLLAALVTAASRDWRDLQATGWGRPEIAHAEALSHAGVQFERRLGDLLGVDAADRAAAAAAERAWEETREVGHFCDLLGRLRRSGRADEAGEVAAARFSELIPTDADAERLREAALQWGHSERARPGLRLRLYATALSDQLRVGGEPAPLSEAQLTRALSFTVEAALAEDSLPDGALADLSALRRELPDPRGDRSEPRPAPKRRPPGPGRVAELLGELSRRVDPGALPSALAALGPLTFDRLQAPYRKAIVARFGPLLQYLPGGGEAEAGEELTEAMERYCEAELGYTPDDAQSEAFIELESGSNVLLTTPTGSGKSTVALFAHFAAFAAGERSIYTAPTKALVNEKFFQLCEHFGPRNVGIMTGDATANSGAPIICCTAEVLASMALSEGEDTPFAWVVMDEFHYYDDRDRGQAWLIPLIAMRRSRFLLMSATIGDPPRRVELLERQTDSDFAHIGGTERPIPLEYTYAEQTLRDSVVDAIRGGLHPLYVVSFTKHEASELALEYKRLLEVDPELRGVLRARLAERKAMLENEVFETPYGRTLRGLLVSGLGVHHAGLLPRYKLLVERLARAGLLPLVSGTDTLGVGVNMPIRTVIFRQLYKFDGRKWGHITARQFKQLAGRAGRRGLGDDGKVWVQAPEHLMQNRIAKAKAKTKGKKKQLAKEPYSYVGWDEAKFEAITQASPETLKTRLRITGPLVLGVLGREGADVDTVHDLVDRAHLERHLARKRHEEVDEVVAGLRRAHLATEVRDPVTAEAAWRVYDRGTTFERPLARFMNDALARLDERDPDYGLKVLSVVESTLEEPTAVLRGQVNRIINGLFQQARMLPYGDPEGEELRELAKEIKDLQYEEGVGVGGVVAAHGPPAEQDFIAAFWEVWSVKNADLLGRKTPSPRAVVREMWEHHYGFTDYVRENQSKKPSRDLRINEGRLLHYLTEALRVLSRELPPWRAIRENETLRDVIAWLDWMIHHVDPSLVHEWERLEIAQETGVVEQGPPPPRSVAFDSPDFVKQVRSQAFSWVRLLARGGMDDRRSYEDLASPSVPRSRIEQAMAPYWEEHDRILTTGDAGSPDLFEYDPDAGTVRQTLLDPEGHLEWHAVGRVDREASIARGGAVVEFTAVGRAVEV